MSRRSVRASGDRRERFEELAVGEEGVLRASSLLRIGDTGRQLLEVDDEVIEEQGARVFLEPEAASLLDDKVLDARVEQNQAAFTIADQTQE